MALIDHMPMFPCGGRKLSRDELIELGRKAEAASEAGPRISRAVYEEAMRAHKMFRPQPVDDEDPSIEDPD